MLSPKPPFKAHPPIRYLMDFYDFFRRGNAAMLDVTVNVLKRIINQPGKIGLTDALGFQILL